ncbi:TetR/AcrR family transcriptional regulator [Nocardiopsis sp. NPDC050513]|uniref:TetR/AcrR family transcriptional regulator n=1 Tax=Nocardiopsis sp. NPDC050513 TaxID=3364338 RepID=UPI0037943C13
MNERPPLRADARRNREQILRAAHAAFLEQGPEAPLDRIADRAGVGNATLYRHFPTRADLATSVVVESMARVRAAAEEALEDAPDPGAALRRFATRVVQGRLVAMLPVLGSHVDGGATFHTARAEVLDVLDRLIDAARTDGPLRADVDSGELILFLTVLSRPLPVLSTGLDEALRARMLCTLLDGLCSPDPTVLPGAALDPDLITEDLLEHDRNGAPPGEPGPP